MKSRLADSGIRRPELLLRALRNTTRGENGAAALELRAALLANGVVRAVHGGAVTRAFLDAASEQGGSALCAVERALVALVKGSEPEPGQPVLDGLVSQEAYAALQRAKSLEPVQSGTGFVYFDSDVPGADVRIAGRSYGRAPVSADDVPTGYQLVEVAAVGHPVVKAYALVEPLDVTVARVKFGASRELVARGSQPTAATPVLAAQVSSDANSLLNALAPAAQPAPQAGEIPLGTMDLFFRAAPALERLVGYPIVIELSTGDMVEGEAPDLL
jgi:hypothetical protein